MNTLNLKVVAMDNDWFKAVAANEMFWLATNATDPLLLLL